MFNLRFLSVVFALWLVACGSKGESSDEPSTTLAQAIVVPPPGEPSPPPTAPPACSDFCQFPHCASQLLHPGRIKGQATQVPEMAFILVAGRSVTFETSNSSPSWADPVLNLFNPSGVQVKAADGGGSGTNARLTYTPTTTGTYRLVLRARANETGGLTTLKKDDIVMAQPIAFGGWQVRLSCLQAGERLETVRQPNGAGSGHALYLVDTDGINLTMRASGNGTDGAAALSLGPTTGTRTVIVGTSLTAGEGQVAVVRNDVSLGDDDHDGLGNGLEQALGTCSNLTDTVQGFSCVKATDAKDTDGDGISDKWEVLGRGDASPQQPLPKWGADPRHKDLFLEVDFMQRCPSEGDDVFMPATTVKDFVTDFGDLRETLTPAQQLAHAKALRNPDNKPGISLHIDNGVDPAWDHPEEATEHGNWGGHNAVARVPNEKDCSEWGQKAEDAWTTNMALARRGIFHYGLGDKNGGGSTQEYTTYSTWAQDSRNAVHEFAHSLGIGHSGPSGASFADANCKPNYPSIMNYGYYDHIADAAPFGFSDGVGRPVLNNAALVELAAVKGASASYVQQLENVFKYNVDHATGDVDWNRDGLISINPVRGYSNYAPGGAGCEWTRYSAVGTSAKGLFAPEIGRIGDHTYLFDVALNSELTVSSSDSEFDCPSPGDDDDQGCNGASFGAPSVVDGVTAGRGIGVTKFHLSSADELFVVGVDGAGQIWSRHLGALGWGIKVDLASTGSRGAPAVAADTDTSAYLAYKSQSGRIKFRHYSVYFGWGPELEARTLDGVAPGGDPVLLPAMSSAASPALAFVPLPSVDGVRRLYGVFADGSGVAHIYRLSDNGQLWSEVTDAFESSPPSITGKPSMVWVSENPGWDFPGRLYFGYSAGSVPRFRVSYAKGLGFSARFKLGLDGPFSNEWYFTNGITFFHEAGIDTNLRAATSGLNNHAISFFPKADGIQDFWLENKDDWSQFRTTLCNTLMHPKRWNDAVDPVIATPVQCPAFPFQPWAWRE